ncbi:MAG: HAMP domain-containing histidine kinase [Holophagaceae bacterium]|nr:HAMP domain-containing histidine kinase [Holophagaceae bacterium]
MTGRIQRFTVQRIIFWSVAALLGSQLAWWISIQVRESRRFQEERVARLKAGRAEAWQYDCSALLSLANASQFRSSPARPGTVEGLSVDAPPLPERKAAIERAFPQVEVVKDPKEFDDPPLVDGVAYLALRPEPILALERERTRALWRTAGQGAFMALGVLLGLTYIYRKLNSEMDLKLRQRNFIASVTHELKTPIASLRVWMETLFTRELSDEQKVRVHDLMDKDLERLTTQVANLLDVARADAGSFDLRMEPLELGPWLSQVAEGMDHRLGTGALGLRMELGLGIWAMADAKALGTALENLLSNAYKYAAAPRETVITLDGDRDEAIIVVSDKGLGIPPKEQARIFQRFYRVGDEMTRAVQGTGLGLFLCKEIVQRHGGEIHVTSKGAGLGSSFVLRLPRLAR